VPTVEIERRADERQMRQTLRDVAEERVVSGVDHLGQHPDSIGQPHQSIHQFAGFVVAAYMVYRRDRI
jgi:hypothetical protein